jgi:transcriptional regulator with AAA-type ATPase domain
VRIGRAEGTRSRCCPTTTCRATTRASSTAGEGYLLVDLRSTNGTAVVRGDARIALDDANGREAALETGDVIELGGGDSSSPERHHRPDKRRTRASSPCARSTSSSRRRPRSRRTATGWRALRGAEAIGAAGDLARGARRRSATRRSSSCPKATHVTVVLREDDEDGGAGRPGYVPIVTRVRGQETSGAPIPVTRSVFRKVVSERAAVIAADAPREVGQTESLMGASDPLDARRAALEGRGDPRRPPDRQPRERGRLHERDLEIMAVLAHNASLAVANARLVKRLRARRSGSRRRTRSSRAARSRGTGARGSRRSSGSARHARAHRAARQGRRHARDGAHRGETGVGKELIAAAVHYRSRRRDKLFVGQNCAAMPENLLESELFGHKKGSFTGAHEEKKGLFEIADGGTLFLDEVTEMPLSLQSKLLRVLQEGEIRPSARRRRSASTCASSRRRTGTSRRRSPRGASARTSTTGSRSSPRVPPLRERREDIPLLAKHFLERYSTELGKPAGGFSQQAMELLQGYDWPGNVRELQNEVQRLVIQIEPGGFVTPDFLSPRIRQIEGVIERVKPTKGTLKEMMDQLERWLLIEALREHENNKTAARGARDHARRGCTRSSAGSGWPLL